MGWSRLGLCSTQNWLTKFEWQRSWPTTDSRKPRVESICFDRQWFVSGQNWLRATMEISTSVVEISMNLINIWLDLHLERGGGRFGRLDLIFNAKTHQLTSWIWFLKMEFHHPLLLAMGRAGFGLGQAVWASKLGWVSGWIALIVIHESINWKFW